MKNKERVGFIKLLFLQRLYRLLLFFNYGFSFAKWLNGTLFHWRKIPRKGNIRLDNEIPVIARQRKSKQKAMKL